MSTLTQTKTTNNNQSARNFLSFQKPFHNINKAHGNIYSSFITHFAELAPDK